jgi:hypothetical protein
VKQRRIFPSYVAILAAFLGAMALVLGTTPAAAHDLETPASVVLIEDADQTVRLIAQGIPDAAQRLSLPACVEIAASSPAAPRSFRCKGALRSRAVDPPLGTTLLVQLHRQDRQIHIAAVAPGQRETSLQGSTQGPEALTSWLLEGAKHVFEGFDHVLFLLCLCAHRALAVRAPTRRRALGDLALLASGFTVGHALTLGAFTLLPLPSPGAFAEASIALTLVLSARAALRAPTESGPRPSTTLVYGAVHGAGMAGALGAMGLPTSTRTLSLLGFNVGVEIAQLLVVALAGLTIATWSTRWPRSGQQIARVVAFGTGISGSYLLMVRVW